MDLYRFLSGAWRDSRDSSGGSFRTNHRAMAMHKRFGSRAAVDFANKLPSAMLYEFGGYVEKKS